MSKEAMTLALEALKEGDWYIGQLETIVYSSDDDGIHGNRAKVQEAIKALEEALAKQEQPTVRTGNCLRVGVCASEGHKIQAKQEQGEPDDEVLGFNGWGFPIEHPPKLKREPLTDDELKPHIEIAMKYYGYDSTKYGLTATSGFVWLARAIEAAHGIKENT